MRYLRTWWLKDFLIHLGPYMYPEKYFWNISKIGLSKNFNRISVRGASFLQVQPWLGGGAHDGNSFPLLNLLSNHHLDQRIN